MTGGNGGGSSVIDAYDRAKHLMLLRLYNPRVPLKSCLSFLDQERESISRFSSGYPYNSVKASVDQQTFHITLSQPPFVIGMKDNRDMLA